MTIRSGLPTSGLFCAVVDDGWVTMAWFPVFTLDCGTCVATVGGGVSSVWARAVLVLLVALVVVIMLVAPVPVAVLAVPVVRRGDRDRLGECCWMKGDRITDRRRDRRTNGSERCPRVAGVAQGAEERVRSLRDAEQQSISPPSATSSAFWARGRAPPKSLSMMPVSAAFAARSPLRRSAPEAATAPTEAHR